jgi:hypothetical protein
LGKKWKQVKGAKDKEKRKKREREVGWTTIRLMWKRGQKPLHCSACATSCRFRSSAKHSTKPLHRNLVERLKKYFFRTVSASLSFTQLISLTFNVSAVAAAAAAVVSLEEGARVSFENASNVVAID